MMHGRRLPRASLAATLPLATLGHGMEQYL
jgi:hypothetical protein